MYVRLTCVHAIQADRICYSIRIFQLRCRTTSPSRIYLCVPIFVANQASHVVLSRRRIGVQHRKVAPTAGSPRRAQARDKRSERTRAQVLQGRTWFCIGGVEQDRNTGCRERRVCATEGAGKACTMSDVCGNDGDRGFEDKDMHYFTLYVYYVLRCHVLRT